MINQRQTMTTLIVSNLILMFGFNVWRAVFNNLAVEDLGMDAFAVGIIQSIREVPGLLGILFVLMVAVLGSEMRSMGVNILILGIGLLVTGLAHGFWMLTLGTLITSIGFHYFYSGSQSVLLQVTETAHTPRALGRLSSVGALASFGAMLSVAGAALFLDNRSILIWGGAIVLVAGLILLPQMNIPQRIPNRGNKSRDALRREYGLFYVLTFLQGTRRHIFTTFAIFLLVRVHGLETWQTALLFLLNSVANFFALPQLGRLVGYFGEKQMLRFNFICLMFIFAGYALIHSTPILIILFILDNIFFGFGLAVNSYFQKIVLRPEDITPNMSFSQSINHIAAVIIPAVGGWLWEAFDPATPFLFGTFVAILSFLLTFRMKDFRQRAVRTPAV